jgi:hypothetical protein
MVHIIYGLVCRIVKKVENHWSIRIRFDTLHRSYALRTSRDKK